MRFFNKIIALVLVSVILFCFLSTSVFASSAGDFESQPTFWDWLINSTDVVWSLFGISNPLEGTESSCKVSDDKHHHSNIGTAYRYGRLSSGVVFSCHCDYCGAPFDALVPYDEAQEILKSGYGGKPTTGGSSGGTFGGRTGYVGTLPSPQINMEGKLLWSPELSEIYFDSGRAGSRVSVYPGNPYDVSSSSVSFSSSNAYDTLVYCTFHFKGTLPIDGFYDYIPSTFSCYLQYYDVSHSFSTVTFPSSSSPGISGLVHSGSVSSNLEFYCQSASWCYFCAGTVYFTQPVYAVTPLSGLIDVQHDETYSPDTRAASFTGDIGIIGDDGQLTKVEGDQIFNETTNYYNNPVTGDTTTVTDWFYDYSDRSYHLTTESGDTVTVTYGDENITIQEGDTTYNVYYIIESQSGSGGDTHVHQWGDPTDTTPATCTTSGSETYTCSECGETKTTTLPALGHKWTVKQTVQTEYDENGELLQEGYTIYVCERCGEEYKSTDGTGPPGGGSQGGDGDSFWDNIVDFFKSIASSFSSIPDWFARFRDFLGSVFSYLPEELVLLLTFGVFAVVCIGIWKAVRR